MRRRVTLLVWGLCGLSSLAQIAPPAPVAAPTPAAVLGLDGGAATLAVPKVLAPGGLPPTASAATEPRPTTRGASGRMVTSTSVGSSSYSQIPSLVLKFSETDEASNSGMEEGLAIMTKLIEEDLRKGVGEGGVDKAMGIDLVYTGSRSVRAMYMEGFGALFMIKVNFPVYSPEANKEPKEPVPAAVSEWERAKRELYGQTSERWSESGSVSSRSKYNPAQVEALKKLLMQTMKNAANIHDMRPEEWISFSVFGHPVALSKSKKVSVKSANKPRPQSVNALALPPLGGDDAEPQAQQQQQTQGLGSANRNYGTVSSVQLSQNGTVMTMRAKRSDVDAFASGKISFEEFAKLVETQSYFGNGYGVLSVNSWLKGRE
jgi:hypothetical protein